MTFQDIINEVESSQWQPKFKWVDSIEECARMINLGHEDYPVGIEPTMDMIEFHLNYAIFNWNVAGGIQSYLYKHKIQTPEFQNCHLDLGTRNKLVKVGTWNPPHPMFLQDLIEKIFPVHSIWFVGNSMKFGCPGFNLIIPAYWYQLFQTIHPFEDLNGRVGGIILACLTHHNGKFLTVDRV